MANPDGLDEFRQFNTSGKPALDILVKGTTDKQGRLVVETFVNGVGGRKSVFNPPGFKKPEPRTTPTQPFVRVHTRNLEGICPECALWIGVEHDGSGTTVPEAPLHDHCQCIDVPAAMYDPAIYGQLILEEMDWVESLSNDELAEIVGRVRATLVAQGALKVRDLWKENGMMYTLEELGYTEQGVPLAESKKRKKK